ncbi:hypothetical protein, partial [Atlantibacter hermannii]|uniref:hypothetical protein n=1 Tax=Atlantibacter hermannii TaxID=565 RepID=UPI002FE0208A
SLQVGRDTASCLSRPQARITRPIPGPRPFGAAASGVQKRSRRFCPCGDDLARQFRLGDFDAGPNTPNFMIFFFYKTPFVAMSISHTHSDNFIFPLIT